MKIKKYLKFISYFIIFSFFINTNVYATENQKIVIPNSITINTDHKSISSVKYGDFLIHANRIRINERNEVVYCLEIEEGYPSGQTFYLSDDIEDDIDRIIASGYPNKTFEELNLDNEDEAYFATQIALWSFIKKYDISKLTGSNINIINAIKEIYNGNMGSKNSEITVNKEYTCSDESVQQVVVVFNKMKYPKQEG